MKKVGAPNAPRATTSSVFAISFLTSCSSSLAANKAAAFSPVVAAADVNQAFSVMWCTPPRYASKKAAAGRRNASWPPTLSAASKARRWAVVLIGKAVGN